MSDTRSYAAPMERCIDAMRSQMAAPENIAKPHWSEASTASLAGSIDHNLRHLVSAASRGDRTAAFIRAANLANHAWMIADNVRDPENTQVMTPSVEDGVGRMPEPTR